MSTATIERDQLVSQPQRDVLYSARREDLALIKTARYPVLNQVTGSRTGTETPGITLQFELGQMRLPLEGTVRTKWGVEVEAAELHQWLRGHRLYGDVYEGFVEVNAVAPPVSAEEMKTLIRLGQAFDRAGLEAFIEQEREGWNRADLIESAEASLAGVIEMEEEALRQAEEQAAAAKPARKPAQG